MKTSELKKIVEDNGFLFRKTNNLNVYIDDEDGNLFSIQNLETIYVERQRVVHTKKAKNVMRALIDYSETPLEEREEEKKYYLRLNTNLKIIDGANGKMMYLNYIKSDESFYIASVYKSSNVQTSFTDKEIKGFNIDTNLFIKEEVK